LLHPTTLDPQEQHVAACATALALRGHAELTTLYACGADVDIRTLPDAADWLARWRQPTDAVTQHRIVELCCDDVGETLLNRAHQLRPDLIVMGTHHQSQWRRMMRGSVAEQVVADMSAPVLLLPLGRHDLLDAATGELTIKTVVVAASDLSALRRAAPWASWLASASRHSSGVLRAVHIGHEPPSPEHCLAPEGWRWEVELIAPSKATIEDELIRAVVSAGPDAMLVMATHGEDSIHDMLFGSHTEHVIARLDRPILVLPY
jgi:nucleotide-binding universal stress UspA family protein